MTDLNDLRVVVELERSEFLDPVTASRPVSVDDLVEALKNLGATIEEVGEPGYYDHHSNDGAFVAAGRYLVYRLPDKEAVTMIGASDD